VKIEQSEVVLAVDETLGEYPSGFAAVCVARIDHVAAASLALQTLRTRLVSDPYFKLIPSVRESLAKDGLHYSQDTPDVKREAIQTLQGIAFEAYIAFTDSATVDPTYSWYDRLLAAILPDRLAENRHRCCHIVAEIHGERTKRLTELNTLVLQVVSRLGSKSGVRFKDTPTVSLATKTEAYLAIPDYIVGCFREYWLKGQHDSAAISTRHFGELWSRVRVVVNTDSGERYWRNRPLPGFDQDPA
jgi:hypothetical protein